MIETYLIGWLAFTVILLQEDAGWLSPLVALLWPAIVAYQIFRKLGL